jgi:hypothetical protein
MVSIRQKKQSVQWFVLDKQFIQGEMISTNWTELKNLLNNELCPFPNNKKTRPSKP